MEPPEGYISRVEKSNERDLQLSTVSGAISNFICKSELQKCQATTPEEVPLTSWSAILANAPGDSLGVMDKLRDIAAPDSIDFNALATEFGENVTLEKLVEAATSVIGLETFPKAFDEVAAVNAEGVVNGFFDQIHKFFQLIWDIIVLKIITIVEVFIILFTAIRDILNELFVEYFRELWHLITRFWKGFTRYLTYRQKRSLGLEDDTAAVCQEELIQCDYRALLNGAIPDFVAVTFMATGQVDGL